MRRASRLGGFATAERRNDVSEPVAQIVQRPLWRRLLTPPTPERRNVQSTGSRIGGLELGQLVNLTEGGHDRGVEVTARLILGTQEAIYESRTASARLEFYTRWLIGLTIALVLLAAATIIFR
jgi:hypothetical protein